MTIKLACDCGQQYSAPDSLAGKTLPCRKCQAALTVPAGNEPDLVEYSLAPPEVRETRDTGPTTNCPECQTEMPMEAVYCGTCGFHQTLGNKLQTGKTRSQGNLLSSLLVDPPDAQGRREQQILVVAAIVIGVLFVLPAFVCFAIGAWLIGGVLLFVAVIAAVIVYAAVTSKPSGRGTGCGTGYHDDYYSGCNSGCSTGSSCGSGDGGGGGCGGCGGGCGGGDGG